MDGRGGSGGFDFTINGMDDPPLQTLLFPVVPSVPFVPRPWVPLTFVSPDSLTFVGK